MLCRACGNEMSASEYCPNCNEAVLWKCGRCDKESEKSVHTYHSPLQESVAAVSVVGTIIGIVSGMYAIVPM